MSNARADGPVERVRERAMEVARALAVAPSAVADAVSPRTMWLLVLVGFGALRFWHLDADAPPWITWSSDLYTDEGWYARESMRIARGLPWHAPGDFVVLAPLPVAPLMLAGWFRAFGVGLVQARALAVLMSLISTASVMRIAAKTISRRAAPWAGLVTLTIYVFTAHARLWFFDIVALAFATAAPAIVVERRSAASTGRWFAAGLVMTLAVLTKTTVVFVLAPLAVEAFRQSRGPRGVVRPWLALGTPLAMGLGAHQLWLRNHFPSEADYFVRVNVVARAVHSVWAVLRSFGEAVAISHFVLGASAVAMLLVLARLRSRRVLWGQPGVLFSLTWIAAHWALMCVTRYHPPRYFLYYVVPAALLLGLLLAHPGRLFSGRTARVVRAIALVGLVIEGARTLVGIGVARYSLVETATDIAARVHAGDPRAVLVGSMADSIALVKPVDAVNDQLGLWPLRERVEARGGARYLVSFGEVSKEVGEELGPDYTIVPLARYDVLGNYRGFRVVLSSLRPVEGRTAMAGRRSVPPSPRPVSP